LPRGKPRFYRKQAPSLTVLPLLNRIHFISNSSFCLRQYIFILHGSSISQCESLTISKLGAFHLINRRIFHVDFPGRSGQPSLLYALIMLSVGVIFVLIVNWPMLSITLTSCLKVHVVILLVQFKYR